MLQILEFQFPTIMMLLVCGFAIIAGSWRERLCGILYLAAYAMGIGFGFISTRHNTAIYMAVADVLLIPGFWVVARRSPPVWAKCVLVIQTVSVAIDGLALTYDGLSRWQYLTMLTAAGYAILACLFVGTIGHISKRRAEKQATRQG